MTENSTLNKKQIVGYIMTKKVVSVREETPLIDAVNILFEYNYNGLPVLNNENQLVGILTEYDLVIKGSSIHLPTFLKLFGDLELYKKDRNLIRADLEKVFKAKVKEVMNKEPLTLLDTTSIEDAVNAFSQHHRVNPIPILNELGEMVGILSRSDVIRPFRVSNLKVEDQREIDNNINKFIDNFDKKFVAVSKFRTRWWLVASLLSAVIGFIVAWALILRIIID